MKLFFFQFDFTWQARGHLWKTLGWTDFYICCSHLVFYSSDHLWSPHLNIIKYSNCISLCSSNDEIIGHSIEFRFTRNISWKKTNISSEKSRLQSCSENYSELAGVEWSACLSVVLMTRSRLDVDTVSGSSGTFHAKHATASWTEEIVQTIAGGETNQEISQG